MNVMNTNVDFNALANDIGVEAEVLPMLFDALKRECERVFPLLADALSLQEFAKMHEYSHAIKGIIGNMRLDDLYVVATNFDNAAKAADESYPFEENLAILTDQLTALFTNFYSQEF